MNSYTLLRAMSGIREAYVLEAQDFLGYEPDAGQNKHVNRKLWVTVLIAAVIVSLLTATAYALGWFGLRERTIEAVVPVKEYGEKDPGQPTPTPRLQRWVSLNGYEDSPEYQANREWLIYEHEYVASHNITDDDEWRSGLSEEDFNISRYYAAYDLTMLEQLHSIAEKYGLSLHTHQVSPLTIEDFYRAAGTGAFLVDGSGSGYVYEDGSFKLECPLDQGGSYLVILKSISGKILPYAHGIGAEEEYDMWEYTNVHGDTVLMAFRQYRDESLRTQRNDLRIFFSSGDVFVEASVTDRSGLLDSGRAGCEKVADRIIFRELLKTDVDLSAAYHEPTVAEEPGDPVTLADFLSSPEGQAVREYSRAAASRRGTEAGRRELEALRPGIVGKYGLTDATQYWGVSSQEHIDSGIFNSEPYPYISYEEFAALGYDRRIAEQLYGIELQDNGVMIGAKRMQWFYIPFGSFCANEFDLTADSYTDEWFYRTSCGAVVTLCGSFGETSTVSPAVIYRTGGGWLIGRGPNCRDTSELEAWAEEIDYTVYP